MDEATLARVEAQRLGLEASIAKLKKSLHHWQTLELDYEGLREEFHLLPEESTPEKCLQVARDFGAKLVDENDLQSLLKDARSSRSPQQLAHLLSKRVEYVAKNAETIRKQVVDAEKRRNALLLAEDPEHEEEAGLPLTEITEELDESGIVVSSKIDRPGAEATNLVDVLEKAGVDGIKGAVSGGDPASSEQATAGSSANASVTTSDLANDPSSDDESSVDEEVSASAAAKAAQEHHEHGIQLSRPPLNPYDSADEARLREEMLNYQGLDEVGAIVAELDLAEGGSDVDYDPDDDELLIGSEIEEENDEDESEDETGRAKHPAISASYKQKMQELEKKLGLKDMTNLGPEPKLPNEVKKELNRPPAAEAARKAAIARENAAAKSSIRKPDESEAKTSEKKPKKKSVAFADALDIAEEERAAKKQKLPSHPKPKPAVEPVGEAIIERTELGGNDPPGPPEPSTAVPKKMSRFKQDKQATFQSPTTRSAAQKAPQTRPLVAPTVIERPLSSDPALYEPPDHDCIDDEMHRRELALEYHKLRNRRIHNQRGYVQLLDEDGDEEDFDDAMQDYGVVDPETGQVRKVSRFKAARVRG